AFGMVLVALGWTASCSSDRQSSGAGGGSPLPGDCSKQCSNGLCDTQLGCVECLASHDCTNMGQPICVLGHCEECGVKADCGTGQSCYPGNHQCAPSCTSSANCPGEAHICDTMSGACVQCLANMDCPAGGPPLCDTTLGRCVNCLQNSDCGAATPICNAAN